jgi:hypothetical protein
MALQLDPVALAPLIRSIAAEVLAQADAARQQLPENGRLAWRKKNSTPDLPHVVQSLDQHEIRQRIDALDRERNALVVLLRAACARDRASSQRRFQKGPE